MQVIDELLPKRGVLTMSDLVEAGFFQTRIAVSYAVRLKGLPALTVGKGMKFLRADVVKWLHEQYEESQAKSKEIQQKKLMQREVQRVQHAIGQGRSTKIRNMDGKEVAVLVAPRRPGRPRKDLYS